jgi:hypothetical protein
MPRKCCSSPNKPRPSGVVVVATQPVQESTADATTDDLAPMKSISSGKAESCGTFANPQAVGGLTGSRAFQVHSTQDRFVLTLDPHTPNGSAPIIAGSRSAAMVLSKKGASMPTGLHVV